MTKVDAPMPDSRLRTVRANLVRHARCAHERISRLHRQAAGAVRARGLHRHQPRLCDHPCHADRSRRAVDLGGHLVRQHRAGSDRADAHLAARALRSRGHADRAISGVLEADPARRFRTVDVGISDSGLDPDRPCAALDRRAAGGLDHHYLGARKPAGRARRLLPEKPRTEADGRDRHGAAPDSLLHSGAAAADRVRLPVAGASDHAAVRR